MHNSIHMVKVTLIWQSTPGEKRQIKMPHNFYTPKL